jgi:transcriptional regulator with XRE-family HTH domain
VSKLTFKAPEDTNQNKKLRKEFSSILSERIKEARTNKGFTQQELAVKSGLHLTYLGHLELGKYHPSVFVLWKIAKALDISVSEIVPS